MIASLRILIAIAVQSLIATAAPVGICLHAYSPEAPAEKIECFEFEKVERAAADYRFFPRADKSVMVTAYRFRGTIPYKLGLAPTHPEFDKLLKLYEETARATPSTRPYLNPKILVMRSQAAGVAKQIEEVAKLPVITMADGTQLIGCTLSKIENGFAIIRHQDGISKVSLTDLDATEKKALNSTAEGWSLEDPAATPKDSTGTFAKIVFKNGVLLKKAKFKEVADGNLVFMADGKSVSVPADQFPGELSVLGEEVVKSLAPVMKESSLEPSFANSGGADSPTAPVQAKRSDVASGGGFVLPGDEPPEAKKSPSQKQITNPENSSMPSVAAGSKETVIGQLNNGNSFLQKAEQVKEISKKGIAELETKIISLTEEAEKSEAAFDGAGGEKLLNEVHRRAGRYCEILVLKSLVDPSFNEVQLIFGPNSC